MKNNGDAPHAIDALTCPDERKTARQWVITRAASYVAQGYSLQGAIVTAVANTYQDGSDQALLCIYGATPIARGRLENAVIEAAMIITNGVQNGQ